MVRKQGKGLLSMRGINTKGILMKGSSMDKESTISQTQAGYM
jgi:hypothetical protein